MSTFKYHTAPNPNGGFTTRAVRGDQINEAALTAAIATATGVPEDKVEAVIKDLFDRLLASAATGGWSSSLSLESLGEVGLITPVIDSIIDMTTSQPDKYTAANMIQLRGNDLRFKLSDLTQGTFFRSGSAAEVRGTLYGQNEPGIVSVAVPAALSGPLQVRHAAFINGSIRSYTYTHTLTPVV